MPKSTPLPQHIDSLRSQFKVMKECPLCEATFETNSIKTVDQSQGSHVLHITCSKCKNALILLVGLTDVGVGLVGLISDLTFEDAFRLKNRQSMTEDDLLDYYQTIYHKSNSFVQLLMKT
ncbi:hypothetical protein HOF40_04485 [Candidatus Parcubacteria bacterium]|jgi:hypothetical protein|nr:hypothetical protein [Candidatus Parcubacteria bacterium]MBT3949321.1 hypothetical protein [Candidatus Parcubacteria bacterium]